MNTLDPTTVSIREEIRYIVQIGRIGGTLVDPVAYWTDSGSPYLTLAAAEQELLAVREMLANEASRFHTGQSRIVKRTVATVIEPLEI